MQRHGLTEREWALIEPHTLGKPGTAGGTGTDNHLFVNAVVWRVRTGVPWRDLPERFGKWNSVARRFRRWAQAGAWHALFTAVQEPAWEWVMVDSTTIKAHLAAAGQKKVRPRASASAAVGVVTRPKSTPSSMRSATASTST